MSYIIRFEGCGTTTVCAHSRAHALMLAKGMQQRGLSRIVISTRDGTSVVASQSAVTAPAR